MYATWALGLTLIVLALLLVQYRPGVSGVEEGFSVAAVDPTRMPACVERSTDAQKLLARFSEIPEEDAAASELRLLVSKLCCLEADIASPSAGMLRTMSLQFRTSHDMEPATSFVSRCLRNAVRDRDVDLVIDKFQTRGHELVHAVLGSGCGDAIKEFDAVVRSTRGSMMTFCFKPQPRMDAPAGVRDVGFWEPTNVASLDAYQGISASQ
jgi:hypothetical protein